MEGEELERKDRVPAIISNRNEMSIEFSIFLYYISQVAPILRTCIIVGVGTKYRETLGMVLCRRNINAAPQVEQPREHTVAVSRNRTQLINLNQLPSTRE